MGQDLRGWLAWVFQKEGHEVLAYSRKWDFMTPLSVNKVTLELHVCLCVWVSASTVSL